MNGAQRDQHDPAAVGDMKRERILEARTAAWIANSGKATVYIPPEVIRPDHADPADYKDGGDLEVRLLPCVDPGHHQIVSVKHDHGSSFTSRENYLTPRIPVGVVGNYNLERMPVAIFTWNLPGTAFAIVYPKKSFSYWREIPVRSKRPEGGNRNYVGYFCPIKHVSRWIVDDTPEDIRRAWFLKAFPKGEPTEI
jgi:hypothetical protein